jgi:hypothetical protein
MQRRTTKCARIIDPVGSRKPARTPRYFRMPFTQRSAGGALAVKGEMANQFPIKSVPDKYQGLTNAINTFIGSLEHRLEMNFR